MRVSQVDFLLLTRNAIEPNFQEDVSVPGFGFELVPMGVDTHIWIMYLHNIHAQSDLSSGSKNELLLQLKCINFGVAFPIFYSIVHEW